MPFPFEGGNPISDVICNGSPIMMAESIDSARW